MAVIRRVNILSCAKVEGTLCAILGLILGAIFALLAVFGAAVGQAMSNSAGAGGNSLVGAMFGLGSVIILPIFYGLFGFVGGALSGALYNLAARFAGGIEIELG
jgi:hypothetical protein